MHFKIAQEKILRDKHGQEGFNKISKKQSCPTINVLTCSKLVK